MSKKSGSFLHTVCPRSLDPFDIANYDIKWGNTSWTYNIIVHNLSKCRNEVAESVQRVQRFHEPAAALHADQHQRFRSLNEVVLGIQPRICRVEKSILMPQNWRNSNRQFFQPGHIRYEDPGTQNRGKNFIYMIIILYSLFEVSFWIYSYSSIGIIPMNAV